MRLRLLAGLRSAVLLGAWALALPVLAAEVVPPADPKARPPLATTGPDVPPERVPSKFDGNHSGLVIGGGPTWLVRPPAGVAEQGLSLRVAGRFGAVLQFVDGEVALSRTSHGGANGAGWIRNEGTLQLATHPGFPMLVFNDWVSDVLAGVHAFGSVSLVRATLTGTAAVASAGAPGPEHGEWHGALSAGVGVDVPVSPRDRDWGLWLTVRYAARWLQFGRVEPELNAGDRQLLVLIGWRTYTTSWGRVPRPF